MDLLLKRFPPLPSARRLPVNTLGLLVSRRALALATVITASMVLPARADRIENGGAVFSALDKVTARISKFEVELNKTVEFGALRVTPRVC
jgi:hypothetical protein